MNSFSWADISLNPAHQPIVFGFPKKTCRKKLNSRLTFRFILVASNQLDSPANPVFLSWPPLTLIPCIFIQGFHKAVCSLKQVQFSYPVEKMRNKIESRIESNYQLVREGTELDPLCFENTLLTFPT